MINVLFVCTGNICRSPAAEAILQKMINDEGMQDTFHVASCGTSSWHVGELADHRMRSFGKELGYDLSSLAEAFSKEYFDVYDYIFVATKTHQEELLHLTSNSRHKEKVLLISAFSEKFSGEDIPDPYYGGEEGFKKVYKMLEECCKLIFNHLRSQT